MKKLLSITAALLLGGLLLTSCNSNRQFCPAYPPSPYHGNINSNELPTQDLIIEEQNNL